MASDLVFNEVLALNTGNIRSFVDWEESNVALCWLNRSENWKSSAANRFNRIKQREFISK